MKDEHVNCYTTALAAIATRCAGNFCDTKNASKLVCPVLRHSPLKSGTLLSSVPTDDDDDDDDDMAAIYSDST
jgi:hypothetical protein